MAQALALVEEPILHVSEAFPDNTGGVPGNCNVPDEQVAEWCGKTAYVLVTADEGFHGRWIRTGLLSNHGVEVIVFDREIKGLPEQHRRITRHLTRWKDVLERDPYGFRVWVQSVNGDPKTLQGKKSRPRSRPPAVTPGVA